MPVKSGESGPWWRNPYIVVPAIVALLAAIVGGITTAVLQTGTGSSGNNAGSDNSTAARPSSPLPPTVSPASATTNTGKLQWQEQVNLSSLQYIDIDASEPSAGDIPNGEIQNGVQSPGNSEYIILSGLGGPNGNIRGGIVTSAQATYDTCHSALNTNPTEQYIQTLEPGQTLCVLSAEAVQHLAALKLISYNSSTMVLVFKVTVWDYSS